MIDAVFLRMQQQQQQYRCQMEVLEISLQCLQTSEMGSVTKTRTSYYENVN